MNLLFGEIRQIVAPYAGRAGKAPEDPSVARFAVECMNLLLYEGSYAGIRKIKVQVDRDCVILPPEVETPLKVKIDARSAEVWNRWYSFHSADADLESDPNCFPAARTLIEDGAVTPLAYQLPRGGSPVGLLANCEEGSDVTITLEGKDLTGREIVTHHKGEKINGVKITLANGRIVTSPVTFGLITGVVKPVTKGYVTCLAVNPSTGSKRFLADWAPFETRPLYKVYRLKLADYGTVANLSILARIKLKDSYLDTELTPFDNSIAVSLAAHRLQKENTNDDAGAAYKRSALSDILDKEAGVKGKSGSLLDVFHPLSPGAIKNIV